MRASRRLEVAHGEEQRRPRPQPERGPGGGTVGRRMEARDVGAARNLHEPPARHAVARARLGGGEVAQHVHQLRSPQARPFEEPQADGGRVAGDAAPMQRRHPAPGAILARRRRQERVECRHAGGARRTQRAVAGHRLVHVHDVRTTLGDEPRGRRARAAHGRAGEVDG
jgi:hypothetical protein